MELPDEGPYETLGGLIMNELGHIPSQGETVLVNGYLLRVEQMDGRRIDRVRITRNPDSDEPLNSPEATHE
mgnify:FL=1